jgi:DNA polymerase III delta prime subunit
MTALPFDVVGCSGPKRYFESLSRETIAHAYLFSGPAGVGKKTFARRLAQSLLCERADASVLGYDETCASCRLFARPAAGLHPDFFEHRGVMKIGSDAGGGFYESEDLSSRDIVRQLSMQSYSGGRRVLLLGDIEFATHHAANALLKFFEEPPRDVVLLLTTTAPGRLLETIRSRLLELRFAPLARDEVRQILMRQGVTEESALRGTALARGSVSRALDALSGDEAPLRANVARWFFEVIEGKTPEQSWATRETLRDGLEVLKALVRDRTVAAAAAGAPLLNDEYIARFRALPEAKIADALGALAAIGRAQRLAATNVAPAMVSELLRMELSPRR